MHEEELYFSFLTYGASSYLVVNVLRALRAIASSSDVVICTIGKVKLTGS